MTKRIVTGLLGVIFTFLLLTGCSKDNDYGTLTVNVLRPGKNTSVLVYPYVTGYDELPPIEEAVVNTNRHTVSFKLAEGNYVVRCKFSYYSYQEQSVQIRSGNSVTLQSTSQGLNKK